MNLNDLPDGMRVIERDWLSSNSILFTGGEATVLVDSGYCSRVEQTVALVAHLLGGRPLERLLNTHLHSDHCGGNAALQRAWPSLRTAIPPGLADAVTRWDSDALGYGPTGQECPRFRFDDLLVPGSEVRLGRQSWQVHAAPGHDPDAVILFEPATRILISADALWEDGFGVIFPELAGEPGFADVTATLDLIERLAPQRVVPGHGRVFACDSAVLARARARLDRFVSDPASHARHAAKVLIKFRLLDRRVMPLDELQGWAESAPYFARIHALAGAAEPVREWVGEMVRQLIRGGAALQVGDTIADATA